MTPKPTKKQIEDWSKQAFKKAKAYTHFPTSMPDNINRAIARIAFEQGYVQATCDSLVAQKKELLK